MYNKVGDEMIYIMIINVIGFVMMFIDKRKAQRHQWRIRERDLWLVALLGGSLGLWIGMYGFRHKTKHYAFVLGIPCLLFIQIWLIVKLW